MNSGTIILLLFLGSIVVVALITMVVLRYFFCLLKLEQVVREGVVMTESGLEILRFFGIGKTNISYSDVESVELLPFYRGPIVIFLWRYGFSARWIGTRLFHKIVVIKLRGPRLFKYLISTPKDGDAFVDQLKARITTQPSNSEPHKPTNT